MQRGHRHNHHQRSNGEGGQNHQSHRHQRIPTQPKNFGHKGNKQGLNNHPVAQNTAPKWPKNHRYATSNIHNAPRSGKKAEQELQETLRQLRELAGGVSEDVEDTWCTDDSDDTEVEPSPWGTTDGGTRNYDIYGDTQSNNRKRLLSRFRKACNEITACAIELGILSEAEDAMDWQPEPETRLFGVPACGEMRYCTAEGRTIFGAKKNTRFEDDNSLTRRY